MKTEKTIAVVAGSFDPVTSGHLDLITRAARLFDEVWVAISANAEKKNLFPAEVRETLVRLAVGDLPNVRVALCGGLVSDFLREKNAHVLVRGARNTTDFDYEYDLAGIMRRFDPAFETVILPTDPALAAVSSTYVRELLRYGAPLGDAVPAAAAEEMLAAYKAL